MISTKEDRIKKAENFIKILLGEDSVYSFYSTYPSRPVSLPRGNNYSGKEWFLLRCVKDSLMSNKDVTIQQLFALEDLKNKYQDLLFLAKMEN